MYVKVCILTVYLTIIKTHDLVIIMSRRLFSKIIETRSNIFVWSQRPMKYFQQSGFNAQSLVKVTFEMSKAYLLKQSVIKIEGNDRAFFPV